MKIKIANVINTDGFTDREKVLAFVFSKVAQKEGYEFEYTFDMYDIKFIIRDYINGDFGPISFSDAFKQQFRMGWYSARRLGLSLKTSVTSTMRKGSKTSPHLVCGMNEVGLTDQKSMNTVFYLIGALNHMRNFIDKTTKGVGHSELDLIPGATPRLYLQKVCSTFELNEMHNAHLE